MTDPALACLHPPAPGPTTDADDIPRLLTGDRQALGAAYRKYAGGLLALVYRLTGSTEDAEDVVQDLFVGLPEALQAYREQGRFDAWLRRIAVRLALMRLRTRTRRREVDLESTNGLITAAGPAPGEDLHLWQELQRLPDDQRAIVVLRVVEGYSHEEIAELLGIRRGAAQVRYHRAVSRLRSLLEEA